MSGVGDATEGGREGNCVEKGSSESGIFSGAKHSLNVYGTISVLAHMPHLRARGAVSGLRKPIQLEVGPNNLTQGHPASQSAGRRQELSNPFNSEVQPPLSYITLEVKNIPRSQPTRESAGPR